MSAVPWPGPSGFPPELLTVPASPVSRVQRRLFRAETQFVARVVQDGGIGPWRQHAADRFRAARRAVTGGRLPGAETAELVIALLDRSVRDWCWLRVEEDPSDEWAALWLHLVRHAVPPFRVEPMFLLAWTAWRCGDLGLTRTAAAAAAADDAGHEPTGMLRTLLDLPMTPADLPSLAEPRRAGEP